jgi:hypothetical protein
MLKGRRSLRPGHQSLSAKGKTRVTPPRKAVCPGPEWYCVVEGRREREAETVGPSGAKQGPVDEIEETQHGIPREVMGPCHQKCLSRLDFIHEHLPGMGTTERHSLIFTATLRGKLVPFPFYG